jgi:hypothetical protein
MSWGVALVFYVAIRRFGPASKPDRETAPEPSVRL